MNGNLIGAVNLPTVGSAAGVWDLEEAKLAKQQNTWPPLLTPDPYWKYVSLLLSGETATTNGSQNNTFLDSSSNNFTLNRNGNATQGSFSPYGSNWSGYFDGGSNRLTTGTSSQFNLSGIDFTIEFFLYADAYPASEQNRIITIGPNDAQSSFTFGINPNGSIDVGVPYSTGGVIVGTANALPLRTWVHIAFTLSSNTGSLYINGTRVGTNSGWNISSTNNNYFYVGYDTTATVSAKFTGFVSNVRFVAGTALYSGSTITVPTAPLTAVTGTRYLALQSNRFLENSVNNFSLGVTGSIPITKFSPSNLTYQNSFSYGAYFDGNGDSLNALVTATPTSLGTNDCTIETWVYLSSLSGTKCIFSTLPQTPAATYTGYALLVSPSGFITVDSWNPNNQTLSTTNNALSVNQWYHIAYTRSSGTNRIFVNGVQCTTTGTLTQGLDNVQSQLVVAYQLVDGYNFPLTGYVSNLRIVKGTAVYTSNFTPPTTQLTAITNTSLLVCQSSTFIDNSTNNFTINVYGNTKPTTFSPFTNTYTSLPYSAAILGGSGYFDGTGDYVNIASQTQLNLGTSNFTIELWFYDDGSSLNYPTMLGNVTGWTTTSFSLRYNNTGHANKVGVYLNPSDPLISSTNTFASRCWHHVALTRSGNTYTLYVDGTVQGSATQAGNFNLGFGGTNIGWSAWDGAQGYYKGYVTDVRVVSGTVLYNSTFVPPNSPLTAISSTQLFCNFTNSGIIDSSTISDSETLGNAQISTAIKKYGFGSIYLDGSGDVVLIEPTQNLEFGSGDFTIEFWLYRVGTGRMAIYAGSFGADYSVGIDISSVAPNTSNTIGIWASSNGTSWNLINADTGGNGVGTIAVAQGVWTHIAYVRNGSTWMSFINGVRDRNITGVSGSIVNRGTYQKAVGSWFSTGALTPLNGYLSDFRISKGLARYTANFTPPATSLPRF